MKLTTPIGKRIRTHQLASRAGLGFTPDAMIELILHSKRCGFNGDFVAVPAAWDDDLTPQTAVEIAMEHDVTIDICGFLPGEHFSPLSKDGRKKAEDEIFRQLAIRSVLAKAGVTGNYFNGPVDHGWMNGVFSPDEYTSWIAWLNAAAAADEITINIEPLNPVESAVTDAFRTLHSAIKETNAKRIKFQYDFGHAWKRKMKIGFFKMLLVEDLVGFAEFANVGRAPLDCRRGIPMLQYIKLLSQLPEGCNIATEPFDYPGVIAKLGSKMEELCDTRLSGFDALKRDAKYFIEHGVMADLALAA